MGSSKKTPEGYRSTRLSMDRRVDDLLGLMTLAEKAGMLFQTMIVVGSGDLAESDSAFGVESADHMINNQLLTHFNVVRAADDARTLADWHNRLQRLAAGTRLGIPITLSTDPRNNFTENVGMLLGLAHSRNGRKRWAWRRLVPLRSWSVLPTSLGGNTSGVGLRLVLHPQIDWTAKIRISSMAESGIIRVIISIAN
jgi:beta-glucosidase